MPRIGNSVGAGSKLVVTRFWGEGAIGMIANGYATSSGSDENGSKVR